MKSTAPVAYTWICAGALVLLSACEDKKPSADTPAPQASAAPTPAPTPTPAPAPTPKAEETGARPEKIETELTADRRSAIETKYAPAKGFVVAKDLEDKLKSNKAIKDKKAAIGAFDKVAKGKWILFSGQIVNLTDDGFDLGIVYTPQLQNDPMGMSRQFFEVTFKDIEGYAKEKFKAGNVVVVLARYGGAAKAGPGHELVSAGVWK